MESAFGADFSAVRIHEDGAADAVGAQAYARGTDLHFGPGTYDPDSPQGLELIATSSPTSSSSRATHPAGHR